MAALERCRRTVALSFRLVPARKITAQTRPAAADDPLLRRFDAIRRELHVREAFPPEVLAEADAMAAKEPDPGLTDLADVPFITIDPAGSMDLDQAMCLERTSNGYRVRYAIADVPAFVPPGGHIDEEARSRGVTIYCPDRRAGLHPPRLAEDAASLLPDVRRGAFVWDMRLDNDAQLVDVQLGRARVQSHMRLAYADVAQHVADGEHDGQLALLKEIGERRLALEHARGGASLAMPEQEVVATGAGGYALSSRAVLPSEDWNAQISLMTGMAAATMMLNGRIGVLRTMPKPDERELAHFRDQVRALGAPWPHDMEYGAFLRTLTLDNPRHLAIVQQAARLFRGAGYTAFDGADPVESMHAAVAAPYAHVTAPLRRLVDRFGLVVCEALANGREVPDWARAALPTLPKIMASADRQAHAVERACVDAVEAAALSSLIGQRCDAIVLDDQDREHPLVHIADPAIVSRAVGAARQGDVIQVMVTQADIVRGTVGLTVVAPSADATADHQT